jgi:putative membrane-bound dehydrogenase-like protein
MIVGLLLSPWFAFARAAAGEEYFLHSFKRQQLTDVYYSEGANAGDLNRDGVADVVHGPYWFAGPDYQVKREIYPAKAQPRERYADNFFSWVYDFNGDGWNDVLTAGFPGTPAFVYENPTDKGFDKPWPKHQVLSQVSNESPHFTQIVGDDHPELVCTLDGAWGYATINREQPFGEWQFHAVSADRKAPKPFGHGLGVGDVDGDDRMDLLTKDGWYQQPASLDGDPAWEFHTAAFAQAGGAEMYAYDVDGDGDNDVITSLRAHEFGLAWYEQLRDGDKRVFRPHLILGSTPAENKYGVLFSELHSVQLADIDGDGLKDIITGKTYWSHHTQSPMWDAGAVVYWFKLSRGPDGVDWIPYQADGEAGIGRQIVLHDLNGDQLPDIVVGGMKGAHVLIHGRESVTEAAWRAAQPRPRRDMANGLRPDEAARQMTVPAGFDVQLAAGEPQVHQPIAFTIDPRGRLWVAEAYTYPVRAPEGQGLDKIVILEDTNGDGSLDKRKIFAEGLNLISGLELGFGGVWVGAAPYVLFIPDKDGDDRPDGEPQVLLDGFGYHDTHETLNSFIWGPDGWLYGCHGVFTHSRVGKPGTPDDQRVPLNAGIWRYHPQRHEFEVFAWGTSNPWGVDFDDHGQAFCTACVIPHLFHVIQGARYQRQAGQHFDRYAFDDIKTIADHAHFAGNIRDHAWWGHEPTELASDTSAAGGGHAHCGAMIYLGDNWPAEHRNRIFFNNVHGNRVNCDLLAPRGSGFVGKHGRDLLLANDHWFRGINLKYGPDGGVYLIDWYDKNACHRVNPQIWDRTNGRIYKIAYVSGDAPRAASMDLAKRSEAELVALQGHSNDWYVRTARRLLQERGLTAAGKQELLAQLQQGSSVPHRLRALWALHATGNFDDQLIQSDPIRSNEHLRAWSIQLALEDRQLSPELLLHLQQLAAHDSSPVVRLYLASALQRLPLESRWSIAAALIGHAEDAEDHNLPLLLWYGLEPLVAEDAERAIQLAFDGKIPLVSRFILRRAASESASLDSVVSALATADGNRQQLLLHEMLQAFEGQVNIGMPKSWTDTYDRLSRSERGEVRDLADQVAVVFGDQRIFPRLRSVLADNAAPLPQRQQALQILVRGRDAGAAATFRAVLSDEALRGAAIRALAAYDDVKTPPEILAVYRALSEEERRDAIGTLVSRPSFAMVLLAAMEQETIPRTDLHAYHVRQLLGFKSELLNRRIQEVWGDVREANQDKQEQIANWKRQLAPRRLASADTSNGRRLFAKNCSTCHTLFGEGQKVGPDITGSNRANLDYILENILDPSAVLGKDYRMTVLVCGDGRIVSGLVQKETDSALTVRTINDTVVVPKAEIEERKLSEQSLMPERLLDSLRPDEVRDLVAYLASPVQVALRGPRAPIDARTGKVPDALEGETLKIVQRTGGEAASQKMGQFSRDVWSGADQLWWKGAKPGDKLGLEVAVDKRGTYALELVMTKAHDYGIVQLSLDGQTLGGPIDLFNHPDVITTGVLDFDPVELQVGKHILGVEIVGKNPDAASRFMFGLDYVRLSPRPLQ